MRCSRPLLHNTHYPDFQVVIDHFQNERNFIAFQAFFTEFKTLIIEIGRLVLLSSFGESHNRNRANMPRDHVQYTILMSQLCQDII